MCVCLGKLKPLHQSPCCHFVWQPKKPNPNGIEPCKSFSIFLFLCLICRYVIWAYNFQTQQHLSSFCAVGVCRMGVGKFKELNAQLNATNTK